MDMGDGGYVSRNIYYMLYIHIFINKAGQDGTIPKPTPNPSWILKKNLKPVPNQFIKIELRPIRDGAGWVP